MKYLILASLFVSSVASANQPWCNIEESRAVIAEVSAISSVCNLSANRKYQADALLIKKSILSLCPSRTRIDPDPSTVADKTSEWSAKITSNPSRKTDFCVAMSDFVAETAQQSKQKAGDVSASIKACALISDFSDASYLQYQDAKRHDRNTDQLAEKAFRQSSDAWLSARSLYIPYSTQDFFALSESIKRDVYIKNIAPSQWAQEKTRYTEKCIERTVMNREMLRQQ